ncbi:unnamed protein product [Prorocentrum cordatum]|uniref:Uncharacterized protein n=1 Tax=Prorocentrum cordatum TaxID=2364126 RepID=A0ABN9QHJ1_9DINO|nr:unnamed protein product [Polarella glacialis]
MSCPTSCPPDLSEVAPSVLEDLRTVKEVKSADSGGWREAVRISADGIPCCVELISAVVGGFALYQSVVVGGLFSLVSCCRDGCRWGREAGAAGRVQAPLALRG